MATGAFYTKYGSTGSAESAGKALFEGQKAVGDSFKDALKGVDDLLKKTEDIYRRENTENVNLYLRDQIKSAGLGADAPEMLDIKSQFGNLIDTDAIDKTITGTRSKMMDDARGQAGQAASAAFDSSGNIVEATNIFKQQLAGFKVKDQDIETEAFKFREGMKYRLEDNAIVDKLVIPAFAEDMLEKAKLTGGKFDINDIVNDHLEDLELRQQEPARDAVAKLIEKRNLMTGPEALEDKRIGQVYNNEIAKVTREYDVEYKALEVPYQQAISATPISASEGSAALQAALAGAPEAFEEKFNGSWWSLGSNDLSNSGLIQATQELDQQLSKTIPDADKRSQIIFAAVSKSVNSGDPTEKGVMLDKLTANIGQMVEAYTKQQELGGKMAQIQNAKAAKIAELEGARDKASYDFTTGIFRSNIYGTARPTLDNPNPEETQKQAIKDAAKTEFKPVALGEHSQMWSAIDKQYGLADGFVAQVAAAEGGGKGVKNKMGSPAIGFHQWMPGTAKQYKVDPNDPQSSGDGIARYAVDAKKILDPFLGREATPAELYLSIIVGPTGFTRLMENPDRLVSTTQETGVAEQNGGEGLTGREFAKLHMDRFNNARSAGTATTGKTPAGGNSLVEPSVDDVVGKGGNVAATHGKTMLGPSAAAGRGSTDYWGTPESTATTAAANNLKAADSEPTNSRGRTEEGGAVLIDLAKTITKRSPKSTPPSKMVENKVARLLMNIKQLPEKDQASKLAAIYKEDPDMGALLAIAIEKAKKS